MVIRCRGHAPLTTSKSLSMRLKTQSPHRAKTTSLTTLTSSSLARSSSSSSLRDSTKTGRLLPVKLNSAIERRVVEESVVKANQTQSPNPHSLT